jgi:hypothetical protein
MLRSMRNNSSSLGSRVRIVSTTAVWSPAAIASAFRVTVVMNVSMYRRCGAS